MYNTILLNHVGRSVGKYVLQGKNHGQVITRNGTLKAKILQPPCTRLRWVTDQDVIAKRSIANNLDDSSPILR